MSQNEGKRRSLKRLIGHPVVGVRLLGMDGLRLHLGGPKHALGGLKVFLELLRL
jgi:hypothetical protein